jgi:hypothetical protein
MVAPTSPLSADRLQAGFLALLPRVRLHAQIFFRRMKCHDSRLLGGPGCAEGPKKAISLWRIGEAYH